MKDVTTANIIFFAQVIFNFLYLKEVLPDQKPITLKDNPNQIGSHLFLKTFGKTRTQ